MGEETTKINEREKKTHILYRQINAHTHTQITKHICKCEFRIKEKKPFNRNKQQHTHEKHSRTK